MSARRGVFCCFSVTARGLFCTAAALCVLLAPLCAFAGTAQGELPVIMYHSVPPETARTGDYVISPETLEEDLRFLSENGYRTITPSQAYSFAAAGEEFPPKSVMLTFDDGFLNNLTNVLPLLEKYDFTAAVAVVGSYSEQYSDHPDPNPLYAYLSWEEICALASSGRVEIANHSYAMHALWPRKGALRRRGETPEEFARAFSDDAARTQTLLAAHCGLVPGTYVYPFGGVEKGSQAMLFGMGFRTALTCREKTNRAVLTQDGLLVLGRFNRPSGVPTEKFMKKLGICS